MKKGLKVVVVACAAVCGISAAGAADVVTKAALEASLDRAAKFLIAKQDAKDGHWSDAQMPALTALPLWALSGVEADKACAKRRRSLSFRRNVRMVGFTFRSRGAAVRD